MLFVSRCTRNTVRRPGEARGQRRALSPRRQARGKGRARRATRLLQLQLLSLRHERWETPRLRPCNCEGDDAAKNELPKVALVPPPLPPPLCPLTASPKRLAKGPDLDLVMAPCAMSAVNVPVPPAPVPPPAALKSELVRDENEERDERAGWPTPTALLLLLPPLPPPPPPAPAVRSSRSWSSESRAMASPRYSPCPSWCCGTEEASGSPRPTRPTPPPNEAPRTELPVPRGAKLRALAT